MTPMHKRSRRSLVQEMIRNSTGPVNKNQLARECGVGWNLVDREVRAFQQEEIDKVAATTRLVGPARDDPDAELTLLGKDRDKKEVWFASPRREAKVFYAGQRMDHVIRSMRWRTYTETRTMAVQTGCWTETIQAKVWVSRGEA